MSHKSTDIHVNNITSAEESLLNMCKSTCKSTCKDIKNKFNENINKSPYTTASRTQVVHTIIMYIIYSHSLEAHPTIRCKPKV